MNAVDLQNYLEVVAEHERHQMDPGEACDDHCIQRDLVQAVLLLARGVAMVAWEVS